MVIRNECTRLYANCFLLVTYTYKHKHLLNLLEHAAVMHTRSSLDSPKQWSPYLSGYGSEHDLSRLWIPTSHVTEQEPHSVHVLQSPFTVVTEANDLIFICIHVWAELRTVFMITCEKESQNRWINIHVRVLANLSTTRMSY